MTERLPFHFPLSCTGKGNGNPLQCSCLENPRDGGAWWAAVCRVTQSWTQLTRLRSSSSMSIESMMPSSLLILCHPLLLLPSIFPGIRVFSNESVLLIQRRQWHPTPVLLPGKSHGWRRLVGCSPWGHKESDMTERLHFHFSLSCTGKGNGNPLQCSCLENPMDRGAWWAAVHGVSKSQTRLSDFTFTSHFHALEKAVATHCSILAWRIPGIGETGGLSSMGSHRVGHH